MIGQRFAVDQLHYDIGNIIIFAVVVNLHDARVHKSTDRLRFVAKARHHVFECVFVETAFADRLDRNAACNRTVIAFVNHAHAAPAEDALDFVLADFFG